MKTITENQNTMNPLAVIGRVVSAAPIPKADRIHHVSVHCGASDLWSGVVSIDIKAGATGGSVT